MSFRREWLRHIEDVSRRGVLGAGDIAAEPGDLGEMEGECSGSGRIVFRTGDQAIEDARFEVVEHEGRFEVRLNPVEHRHPEHAPAQDTERRDQPDRRRRG